MPLTFVDLSSSERVHFWRTRATEEALSRAISILHGAKDWETHAAFAACAISRVPPGRKERSRPHRCRRGHEELRDMCRQALLPAVGGLTRGGKPSATAAPAAPPRCPPQYGRYWGPNVTWCTADPHAPKRMRPATANVSRDFCRRRAALPPRCPYIVPKKLLQGQRERQGGL